MQEIKNKFIVNYVAEVLYNIELVLIPLILTPYISRTLGAEEIGKYGYVQAISVYFTSLASFGTSMYAQKEIAKYRDDDCKIEQIVTDIVKIKIVLMLIGYLGMLILCFLMPDIRMLLLIQSISVIACAVDTTWYYYGLEQFTKVVGVFSISRLVSLVLVLVFVNTKNDTMIYALVFVLCDLISQLLLSKKVIIIFLKNIKTKIDIKKHLHPIVDLFIPQISTQLYSTIDKSMIVWITGSMTENGYYEQTTKIVAILNALLVETMGYVLLPRMANLFGTGKEEQAKREIQINMTLLIAFALPLIAGLMAISGVFIPLFLGEEFQKSEKLLRILCLNILPIGIYTLLGKQVLVPIGKYDIYSKTIIVGTVSNILMNIVFISYLKSEGACIASLLSNWIIAVVHMCYTRNYFSLIKLMKDCSKSLISSIVMLSVIIYLANVVKCSLLSIVLLVILGIVVYFISEIVLRDVYWKNIIMMLRKQRD